MRLTMKRYHIQELAMREMERLALQRLINEEPDLNAIEINGLTPIAMAAALGLDDLIKPMVEKGADILAAGEKGSSALAEALSGRGVFFGYGNRNQKKMIETLFNNGAKLDEKAVSILVDGFSINKLDVLKIFLSHGMDINAKSSNGNTFLHKLADSHIDEENSQSVTDVAKFLIDSGIDIDAVNNDGKTALSTATWSPKSKLPLLKVLLDSGANIEAPDQSQRRPLIRLCTNYYDAIMPELKFVLERNANPNAVDKQGNTALTALAFSGRMDEEAAALLMMHGADPSIQNNQGYSVANDKRYAEIISNAQAKILMQGAAENALEADENDGMRAG